MLLTAVVGALNALLAGRGERIDTLVVSMPVSARWSTTATHVGNNVGVLPVALPADDDHLRRLSRIATITRARKTSTPGSSAAVVDPAFRALGAVGVLGWCTPS